MRFRRTLPFTHLAVEGLSPFFVTAGRAALAGLLAAAGIAHVSQVQLLQTFVTLGLALVLNGESVGLRAWLVASAVLVLVLVARHTTLRKL